MCSFLPQDLCSSNMYDAGVALTGLSCFISPDLAQDLANDIMSLVRCIPYISLLLSHQPLTLSLVRLIPHLLLPTPHSIYHPNQYDNMSGMTYTTSAIPTHLSSHYRVRYSSHCNYIMCSSSPVWIPGPIFLVIYLIPTIIISLEYYLWQLTPL